MADRAARASEELAALLLSVRKFALDRPDLVEALEKLPREKFLPTDQISVGWRPISVPIACGQRMHDPELTLRLIHSLDPHTSLATLEVGTGSGFQTAILARMSKKVHSIDRYRTLLERARSKLQDIGVTNVTLAQADARRDGGDSGTYDRIIVDSCFEEMPRHLLDRLAPGGIVVTAIGGADAEQVAVKLTKIGNRFDRQDLFPVRFSPLEHGVAAAL
ncbi:MAG: methyltransferase domain-containing protein [Ahrensia sp.]|nr:methyltransferase domain-containing protein [Ahrensia sp.]